MNVVFLPYSFTIKKWGTKMWILTPGEAVWDGGPQVEATASTCMFGYVDIYVMFVTCMTRKCCWPLFGEAPKDCCLQACWGL